MNFNDINEFKYNPYNVNTILPRHVNELIYNVNRELLRIEDWMIYDKNCNLMITTYLLKKRCLQQLKILKTETSTQWLNILPNCLHLLIKSYVKTDFTYFNNVYKRKLIFFNLLGQSYSTNTYFTRFATLRNNNLINTTDLLTASIGTCAEVYSIRYVNFTFSLSPQPIRQFDTCFAYKYLEFIVVMRLYRFFNETIITFYIKNTTKQYETEFEQRIPNAIFPLNALFLILFHHPKFTLLLENFKIHYKRFGGNKSNVWLGIHLSLPFGNLKLCDLFKLSFYTQFFVATETRSFVFCFKDCRSTFYNCFEIKSKTITLIPNEQDQEKIREECNKIFIKELQ